MNKLKASKKDIKNNNYYIMGVGYCNMYNLLRDYTPIAYSTSIYGWACDYYDINGVIISTGYQPLSNKNINYDYKELREIEEKARNIIGYNEEAKNKRAELLHNFINKCIEEEKNKRLLTTVKIAKNMLNNAY